MWKNKPPTPTPISIKDVDVALRVANLVLNVGLFCGVTAERSPKVRRFTKWVSAKVSWAERNPPVTA